MEEVEGGGGEGEAEATATATALQELSSLRTLHASLLALKEMVKAVNKDYTTLSENYESLTAANEQWKVLVSHESSKAKK